MADLASHRDTATHMAGGFYSDLATYASDESRDSLFADFVNSVYAVYRRNKVILWIILPLYVAEIVTMMFGSVTSIIGMHVTSGCLILAAPRTYFACWLSALSFQTIVTILLAANFFLTTCRERRGHTGTILRIIFRDGSWAYALIFLVTLSNSMLYQIGRSPTAGTPYAWAMALYSFAGCHLQMNIHKNTPSAEETASIYPPFTSHIEMRGVSIDEPVSDAPKFVTPMHFGLP